MKKPKAKSEDFLSFYDFFLIFLELNNIQLTVRDFHKEVCETLQNVFLGILDKKIVIINISPRVGKTKLMEAFIAWCYAYFRDCHFIYASYSADLATSSTRYVLETMEKEWFIDLFGRVSGDVKRQDFFTTKHGGVCKGDGISGTLTGFGAGLKRSYGGALICDDLQKPKEALSKASTKEVQEWLTRTMSSRLNSTRTPVIVCAQRISENDACGFLMKNFPDDYVLLKYPALVNEESTIPDTKTTKELKDLERVDPFTFYSQYQQEPIVLGGNLIKTEWFKLYKDEISFDYKIISADTAQKTKEHNDYSVFTCWGVSGKNIYLCDMIRGKFEAHILERVAIEFLRKHSPREMLIEDKSSGTGLIQVLINKGFPITPISVQKDKLTRVMDSIPYIAAGNVFVKSDENWVTGFFSETAGFRSDMGHEHDDQVDSMTQVVKHFYMSSTSILYAL